MEQASADIASNATIATPIVVWNQRHLPDRLVVTVVYINLNFLAEVGIDNLHKLINVVKNTRGGAQQVVLKWHEACVRCW